MKTFTISNLLLGVIASIIAAVILRLVLPDPLADYSEVDLPPAPAVRSDDKPPPSSVRGDDGAAVLPQQKPGQDSVVKHRDSPIHAPKTEPFPGLGLLCRTEAGMIDTEFSYLIATALPHAADVMLSEEGFRFAIRNGMVAWDESLPSSLLLVETSTTVSPVGGGRFRSEATASGRLLVYNGITRRFRASAVGAGFSRLEAQSNSKLKASENLIDQLRAVGI